ncbi:hypothetical protein SNEBB_009150 [Seison nebaliae]|nr:hypothetical protein SNEBB_009150 [Seison nebaliae]
MINDDLHLDKLFHPDNIYYTPIDEQILKYEQKDLRPVKVHNIANKYWQYQNVRKRRHIMSNDVLKNFYSKDAKDQSGQWEKMSYPNIVSSLNIDASPNVINQLFNTERTLKQRSYFLKKFENGSNLLPIENRVLRQLTTKNQTTQTDIVPCPDKPKKLKAKPKLKEKDLLNFLDILQSHVNKRKERLLDLFKYLDRDQTWKISLRDLLSIFYGTCNKVDEKKVKEIFAMKNIDSMIDYKLLATTRCKLKLVKYQKRNKSAVNRRSKVFFEECPLAPISVLDSINDKCVITEEKWKYEDNENFAFIQYNSYGEAMERIKLKNRELIRTSSADKEKMKKALLPPLEKNTTQLLYELKGQYRKN